MIHLDLLDRIVLSLQETLNGSELTPSHLMILTTTGMEIVETISTFSGPQKKDMVVQALSRVTNSASLSDDSRDQLEDMILNLLPSVIDVIISTANGQYKFKHKPKGKVKKTISKILKKSD